MAKQEKQEARCGDCICYQYEAGSRSYYCNNVTAFACGMYTPKDYECDAFIPKGGQQDD